MDLWGQIYLDHWRGEVHPHEFVRDDGRTDVVADAAGYFAPPRDPSELAALAGLGGRVLDLGCGAGSHALFLEGRGVAVIAVDASPGAVAVCRERGCRDVRLAEIDALPADLGDLDGIICMGNTLGIGTDAATLPRRLAALRSLVAPSGRLLAAIRDPLATTNPDHLAYHARNRARGLPVGLVRSRLRYRGTLGPWWDLWMPTESELVDAAWAGGWHARRLGRDVGGRLYELSALAS